MESKGKNNPNYKTGFCQKGADKKFYNSWQNMKHRCLNPNHPKYHRYGGRGITICAAWMTIEGFSEWANSSGWQPGLSIDRINNDGNYEPKNCRWLSQSENSRKKSTTKLSMDQANEIRERLSNGEDEYNLAEEYGVVHGTIWFIKNNFTHTVPGRHSKKKQSVKYGNKL